MGETSPPTAADWASSAAHVAEQKAYEAGESARKARSQMDLLLGLLIRKQFITAAEANQIRYLR
jgi:hypothetical protein